MPRAAVKQNVVTSRSRPENSAITIGGLARAADVGVETVRYYQRRGLLAVPHSGEGSVRRYSTAIVDRIRFIKRSQHLGFTLDEIRELLQLERGASQLAVRKIAGSRLQNIRDKIRALKQMEIVLADLLTQCERAGAAAPCPIIAALNVD